MKVCSKCKEEKELYEFGKDKHSNDGLTHGCKDCRNKTKRSYDNRMKTTKKDTPRYKTCSYCGEERSNSEFYKQTHTKDGLSWNCKRCRDEQRRVYRERMRYSDKPNLRMKTCFSCSVEKDVSEFNSCSTNRDGLQVYCKVCNLTKSRDTALKNKIMNIDKTEFPESKRCSRCQEDKPSDQFHRQSETSTGLSTYCKPCNRIILVTNVMKNRENHIGHKLCKGCNNDKLVEEFHKQMSGDGYDGQCKECREEQRQKKLPKDGLKQCSECGETRAIAAFHKDTFTRDGLSSFCVECQYIKQCNWRTENPHKGVLYSANYRSARINATPSWANLEMIEEIYASCPRGYHVDHIIPLRGELVCGLHCEYNLQYLTPAENASKNNQLIEELPTINNSYNNSTLMEND